MLRPVSNPVNRFVGEALEWLDEPPPAELSVFEEQSKSILSENDSPDIAFRWSLNPYRGCQHACAYCYARPTHEYLGWGAGTDFDTRIVVKVNAAELLERELSRRDLGGESITFSGVTDCYQPLEAVYRVTRACLEVCVRAAQPVAIVTKSFLVTRDADLLAALTASCGAKVYVSVAFADDANARRLEPHAPPPSRRMDAMRRLCDAGVPVSVMVAPLIPGLNDRDVPAILARAAEYGASGACYTPLRLPGNVAPVFLERLRAAFPDRAKRIEALQRSMRGGNLNEPRFGARFRGEGAYWSGMQQLFEKSAVRFGLKGRDMPPLKRQRATMAPSPRVSRQLPLF